ncbi:MAG: nucleotide exchange factor GrpE [Pseudomonadota bacterium]|nr:nucleotide exchange factor GrpE [Pseudomonadota bacterium]
MVKKDLEEKKQQPVGADDLAPQQADQVLDADREQNDKIKMLEDQLASFEEKHARLMTETKETIHRNQADLDNYRKRMDRELEKSKAFMLQKICQDLLPVIDSVDAAKKAAESASDAVKNGLEMTVKLFLDVLNKHGVSKVDAKDQAFDHNIHEAMTSIEQPGVESGQVVEVIQEGYKMGDRLLRPARVIVAK